MAPPDLKVTLRLALSPTPLWRVACSQRPSLPSCSRFPFAQVLHAVHSLLGCISSALLCPPFFGSPFRLRFACPPSFSRVVVPRCLVLLPASPLCVCACVCCVPFLGALSIGKVLLRLRFCPCSPPLPVRPSPLGGMLAGVCAVARVCVCVFFYLWALSMC